MSFLPWFESGVNSQQCNSAVMRSLWLVKSIGHNTKMDKKQTIIFLNFLYTVKS